MFYSEGLPKQPVKWSHIPFFPDRMFQHREQSWTKCLLPFRRVMWQFSLLRRHEPVRLPIRSLCVRPIRPVRSGTDARIQQVEDQI